MIRNILNLEGFTWVDLGNPTDEEYEAIALRFELSSAQLKNSINTTHLPRFEHRESWSFAVLRAYDDQARVEADTIQELTHKVAVFYNGKVLITLHKYELSVLEEVITRWLSYKGHTEKGLFYKVLGEIFLGVIDSYAESIQNALEQIDDFETKIFMGSDVPRILEQLYFLKRKASVYRRLLRMHGDLLKQLVVDLKFPASKIAVISDRVERIFFQADTLQETTLFLFNAHSSISAQRTNEVMRVLTLFSVFFMPLTFIVGIYGMNFQFMPELSHRWGYLGVWLLMICVSAALGLWFWWRGWLRSRQ